MQAENREAHPSNSTVEAVNRPADGAAESNEGAERLSAEQLRAVAEEVRGAFPHPFQGCELLLVDVDPYQLHAFWSVPLSAIQTAQQRLGLASEQASMVLRLFDLSRAGGDDGTPFDVPVGGLQSQCYIDIWGKGRRLRGELGLLAADGSFVTLAASNTIEAPPAEPSSGGAFREVTVERPPAAVSTAAESKASPKTPSPAAPASTPATAEGVATTSQAKTFVAKPGDIEISIAVENILPLSSFVLAGGEVEFEVATELHIYGRARPDRELHLFGQQIPLRPDGSFSIRRLLRLDPALISALLASEDGSVDLKER